MRRVLAIAGLTWKAALRYRLFWVLSILLVGTVVALPLVIKDDGTARGFIQILLAYTLSLITALLGFATVWMACGTLARDVEECQIQMVLVKPIARWQVWLGKWLGILFLNLLVLGMAGACLFFLLQYRAGRLSPGEQAILKSEVFVARASIQEPPLNVEADVEKIVTARMKEKPLSPEDAHLFRQQVTQELKSREQVVPPGYQRRWQIDMSSLTNQVRDQPLFVRVKFMVGQTNSTGNYLGIWRIGPPEKEEVVERSMAMADNTFYEFLIPPNKWGTNGVLSIDFQNRNDTAMLFPASEGLQVLYKEGTFGLNFARGLGIIFCWLALLACLGLMTASFLSFPVAAFCSMTLLFIGLSSGTLSQALEEGSVLGVNQNTGRADSKGAVDYIILPVFKGLLTGIQLVENFSPIESLSTGRSITWGDLGRAVFHIVGCMGGLFAAVGIFTFSRRELATAQGVS